MKSRLVRVVLWHALIGKLIFFQLGITYSAHFKFNGKDNYVAGIISNLPEEINKEINFFFFYLTIVSWSQKRPYHDE